MTMLLRSCVALLLAGLALTSAGPGAAAQGTPSPLTIVLPLRTIGLSDTTAYVSRDLLAGSLTDLGLNVVPADPAPEVLPRAADACDQPACAAALARERGAEQAVFGTLSKLGGKIIARVSMIRVGEETPYYRDQLTATSEEDLDRVMRRFAEGIAGGRPNSDRATVESVTQAETRTPARRASRSGFGIRAGFLFPTAGGFGGADRLTNLRAVYKYEMPTFQIESSTVLGFTWGDGNFDWAIIDLSASRIFGTGDFATYLGGGIGVHSVTVEQRRTMTYETPGYPSYSYDYGFRQTETVPTLDLIAGVMSLRTYDFHTVIEVRFRIVFEKFDDVGGKGANGVLLTFGTSR